MKMLMTAAFSAACITVIAGAAKSGETPSPKGAKVYFINVKDGETVKSPLKIQFGLSGMGVAPAGVQKENTGHHHILIDTALSGNAVSEPIPADDTHKHFGAGQTETSLTLAPGKHTLQLVVADWTHIPHNPPIMSDKITVTVK
jgi:hypothetical protein